MVEDVVTRTTMKKGIGDPFSHFLIPASLVFSTAAVFEASFFCPRLCRLGYHGWNEYIGRFARQVVELGLPRERFGRPKFQRHSALTRSPSRFSIVRPRSGNHRASIVGPDHNKD
ncbi:hypothetical protein CPB83DRAFT_852435, partial [Crepidotus variabilis]